MRKSLFIWPFLLFASLGGRAQERADSLCTTVGFVTQVSSEQLGEVRKLYIHLPDEYSPEKSYPVVFLLDGEATFRAFAAVTGLMAWQGLIPPCIVVGIPNIHREMDYAPVIEGIPESGRADKMRSFYREELFPFLEEKYHTGKRILYGHSWVGFFATYVMLTEPGLFDAYISTSPMFRFFPAVFPEGAAFTPLGEETIRYYLTLGGEEVMSRELEHFIGLLEAEAPLSLEWKFSLNEGKNHDSNAIHSYMEGLQFIFSQR